MRTTRHTSPEFLWISQLPFLIVAVIVVVCLVWLTLGTEYWRIGPGLLEVRKECLGRKWGPWLTFAVLRIRVQWRTGRVQRYPVYLLVAQGGGKDVLLSEAGASGAVELQSLGSYLSAQTGWPLELPTEWPPVSGFWWQF
jgi:hypothetical protein